MIHDGGEEMGGMRAAPLQGDVACEIAPDVLCIGLHGRTGLSEPPWYTIWDRTCLHDSITRVAELAPAVLGGGHGQPLTGPETPDALSAFAAALGPKR